MLSASAYGLLADNTYLDLDYSGYHKNRHPIIAYYHVSYDEFQYWKLLKIFNSNKQFESITFRNNYLSTM